MSRFGIVEVHPHRDSKMLLITVEPYEEQPTYTAAEAAELALVGSGFDIRHDPANEERKDDDEEPE